MRKFFGFIAGFLLAFSTLVYFFSAARAIPRGPFWVTLCIGVGLVGAHLANRPRENLLQAQKIMQSVTQPWWKLEKRLRFVFAASVVWMVGAYSIQDKYDENMGVVFIPALAVVALHFLVRFTVVRTDQPFVSTSKTQSIFTNSLHFTDATNHITESSQNRDISSKSTNSGELLPNFDYPFGIALINGMYQFRDMRFLRIADAIFAAELIFKKEEANTPPSAPESSVNDMYVEIAKEFETNIADKGLWIRLFAECDGDETKTKVRYIRERILLLSSLPAKSTNTQSSST